MYVRKTVVCAILPMALLLGMSMGAVLSEAAAKECYRPGDCGHACYYECDIGAYWECREVYKRAVRDDACGIGLKSPTPCGHLYVGTVLCDTRADTCGGDSYTNGEC